MAVMYFDAVAWVTGHLCVKSTATSILKHLLLWIGLDWNDLGKLGQLKLRESVCGVCCRALKLRVSVCVACVAEL